MTDLLKLLGDGARSLIEYKCTAIPKESLHLPGPDFVDRTLALSDRKNAVLIFLNRLDKENASNGRKPEGFSIEIADAIIRILDMCEYLVPIREEPVRAKSIRC